MAKKKSKAQIKRLMKRAAARGEDYQPPEDHQQLIENSADEGSDQDDNAAAASTAAADDDNKRQDASQAKVAAAIKLQKELKAIEENTQLKSKERRSAKRKAEAIAAEATNMSAKELLEWHHETYDEQQQHVKESRQRKPEKVEQKKQNNPYIVFVGQLSFDTTKDSLFRHIQKELGNEHEITQETVQIRLLTDATTKTKNKSRGMAFVQLNDPELLYACLKLHHTMLDGRRINVERSAGGSRNSTSRASKLKQYRQEQEEYMGSVVDTMIDDYKKTGDIQENELDQGVVALCKRHSACVVQAALERYIESNGKDMDNPSSYLTFLLGKIAEEGIIKNNNNNNRQAKTERHGGTNKRARRQSKSSSGDRRPDESVAVSKFVGQGVDMPMSKPNSDDLATIFPSYSSRGRGRGRGYM